jgi:hypothetical protein
MQILPEVVAVAGQLTEVDLDAKYLPEPREEILPGDTLVHGNFPEELKRLYVLWQEAQAKADHCLANLRNLAAAESKNVDDAHYLARHMDFSRLSTLAGVLRNIFYGEIRQAFPEVANRPLIFVRKSWKVVWRVPKAVTAAPEASSGAPVTTH